MRKTLAVAIAAALLAGPALAADAKTEVNRTKKALTGTGTYGLAGCGLGSMVLGAEPGAPQVLAATLNATGFQTFGITTGTSNCGPGLFAMGTKNFVEANREALAKDAARGQGDAVGAIAVINACPDSHKVGAALQRNFKVIFPSETASSDEVTAAILKTLHDDAALGCGTGG